jgi:hypothetical protein
LGNRERTRTTPLTRPWIGGILAALSLVALLVVPVFAAEPGPTLTDPEVDPRAGRSGSVFTLRVTYTDPADQRPDYVRVRIGGRSHRLSRVQGHDWRAGVRYRWSGRLPSGTHDVVFLAQSRDDVELTLAAGTIEVDVAATPTPEPAPTARATAKPTPKPRATAKPKPTSTSTRTPAPRSTPKPAQPRVERQPHPTPDPTPVLTATIVRIEPGSDVDLEAADPTAPPDGAATTALLAAGIEVGPGRPGDDGSNGPQAVAGSTGPDADDGPTAGGAGTWGPLAMVTSALGLGPTKVPVMPLVPTVVTTTGVAAASMALGLFGRKRRDEEQPDTDEVLAAQAAEGVGIGDGVAHALGEIDDDGLMGPDGFDLDAELQLPRWRRPSLLQARKADPLRTGAVAPRLAFDSGFTGALAGNERRLVRYTVVRLLDAPDELRGNEIGILGEGDEVELLEKQGVYWLVGCPDGGRGWIHQMTLGNVVGQPALPDAPSASLPAAPETWTMGDSDVDDDVLAAYLASRQRAG